MAASNQTTVQILLVDKCANCLVFSWEQPEPSTLRKCKQCKVVQYCSESCQKEHWKLMHKKHCRKIAANRSEAGDCVWMGGIFSPIPELLEPKDALVMVTQMILFKMQYNSQSIYSEVSSWLTRFEAKMRQWMVATWGQKKIFPGKLKARGWNFDPNDIPGIPKFLDQTSKKLASQDLWLTLHLVVGRLPSCVDSVPMLKDPTGAVPPELWIGFQPSGAQVFLS